MENKSKEEFKEEVEKYLKINIKILLQANFEILTLIKEYDFTYPVSCLDERIKEIYSKYNIPIDPNLFKQSSENILTFLGI